MRDPSHPMIKPTKDILAHVFNSRRPPAKLHRPILYEIPTDLHGLTDQQTIDERKGYLFEQFVVTLFDREYFTLLEWRSDKCIDGIFQLTCQFPDLEFYFHSQSESLHFAVECKWRQYFTNGIVEWSKETQLANHKQFEKITQIPVFIVLGIGGYPNKPDEVYAIPLGEIDQTSLHCMTLKPYQRKLPYERFFLNCSKLTLT